MVYLRRSNKRGPSDLGCLQSLHTFSFDSCYDPDHMCVSVLRAINDDQVLPAGEFQLMSAGTGISYCTIADKLYSTDWPPDVWM